MSKISLNRSFMPVLFLLTGILFLIIESCRKMDKPVPASLQKEKFFQLQPGTDPLVVAIAQNIQRQDIQRNLVSKLVGKAGLPVWNKAVISKVPAQGRNTVNEQQVFIPFINEEEQETKALLSVRVNEDDTLFSMVYAAAYRQYGFDSSSNGSWSARDVFGAFSYFNKTIFNHTSYYLSDSRVLGTALDTIGAQPVTVHVDDIHTQSQARLQSPNPGTIIVYITYVHCEMPSQRVANNSARIVGPNCYNATYTQQQVTFHLDDNYPGGGYFDGEGGGGSDGHMCIGCNWEDINPCNLDPNAPQEPCYDDWQPVPHAQPEPFDPMIADSVEISDHIRDSFPCLYTFLKDSLLNPNRIAQLAGTNIFQDSIYMHLRFDTSGTRTANNQATGHTNTSFVVNAPDGREHCIATIRLNPWHLKHASQEIMIATIIHECMHAIFKTRWWQYQAWLGQNPGFNSNIDSNFLKQHFPSYWTYMNNKPFTPAQEHQIMATDYFARFEELMRPWFNPGAPTAIRDSVIRALGYGGLYETDAWKQLPSMGMDTCKYKGMNVVAEQCGTGSITPTGCGSGYNYHYANDLKLRPSCN